ncbi:XrtB/PEP-CTERM-associated polysaccharide biosynthesis outer membrane protein EpsL [Ramlibacter sp. AN1015]|uniref:XrtB/PEP-CTERM-associated polysaccharide biosynthesis outer membrane protein EpsL n=1 Tax=Ramlibacter sp. AN1015 TaxID=3133428 RepID=UPI0030BA9631
MKKNLKRSAFVPAACLCIAWPLAHAQNAETGDTLQFRVGAALERDSNVLRAPDGPSDTVGILTAGARYDKQFSLQRVVLDAEVATHRHQDFSSLNYNTLNYNAAWNFAITPRFRGVLSATQNEYRDVSVATTGVSESNVRTERIQLIEGTYAPGGGFLAQAGLSHSSSEAEVARTLESSPSVRSLRLGTGYETARGSSVILQYRRGDGEYDNLATDFKENELSVIARWPVTAKTTLDGSIGYLERDHDGNPAFDFDGLVANVGVNWEITGKTSLNAGIERNLGSYEVASGGYVRSVRTFIQPIWRATAKTAVRLRYQREDRTWVTTAAAPDFNRSDDVNAFGVFVDWEPVRRVVVSGAIRTERRDSSIDAFDYRATIVGVGARYTF